ncbi:MAG TPA: hypothetical protein VGC84_18875 [Ilumatobacteraceae bacterium]
MSDDQVLDPIVVDLEQQLQQSRLQQQRLKDALTRALRMLDDEGDR